MVILEYCLLVFKTNKSGYPYFAIIVIDIFLPMSLKTQLLPRNVFDVYFYVV